MCVLRTFWFPRFLIEQGYPGPDRDNGWRLFCFWRALWDFRPEAIAVKSLQQQGRLTILVCWKLYLFYYLFILEKCFWIDLPVSELTLYTMLASNLEIYFCFWSARIKVWATTTTWSNDIVFLMCCFNSS